MVQSSSSSGIFFQEDGQTNFGSSSNSLPPANVGPFSGDVSNTVLNSVASSGPSIGASSLVTDANSGLSGGPHLQRSASINTESYTRLPASPISFSSNNISISGASVMDGSSVLQQSPNQGASSATSLPRLQKRPRLDIKQEDIVQQQVMQQLLQRRDQMHLHNSSPQLQALIQQQRLRQQEQQVLQSMTPIQRVQFLQQQQQQMQLRQQLQVQGMPPASAVKRPYDGGVCSRRLMQYLYHQRQWPADNSIAYWRKFVAEYYSPRAKKRWCLSQYNNVGHHALGVFPQAAKDAWQCDICGSKSGRGFEATFEVLPRLNEIKFSSGVVDELLFLDLPRECRFPSGIMMLEYAKAVQESVYEQLRVVREGQLRILFAPDLKILSWEFCARRHEELLPRKLVAPQVNQLLEVAQKCQSTIAKSGPDGVSQPDLQANSVLVVTAGHQLARSLELQSLNDLGFSKRYVRCLQIADVVNSMKDLMDFCRQHKKGPIEGLKNFPQRQSKFQMDPTGGFQGLPTDRHTLNNLMAFHPGLITQTNNNYQQHVGIRGRASSGSPQAALTTSNYQNLLTRQNSMNSTNSPIQHGPSSSNQAPSSITPGHSRNFQGVLPNGLLSLQQNQLSQPLQGGQALQQQMIQQYLQDMRRNNNSLQNQGHGISGPGPSYRSSPANSAAGNGPCVGQSQQSSRSNSFKVASPEGESRAPIGETGLNQKASDLPQSRYFSDEMVSDIGGEFMDNGFFDDFDDNMNFSWKE